MANTSNRRVVSRPGVNGDATGSNFQSPYQPPASGPDFEGDLTLMDPDAYTLVHVGDYFWRVKVPSPGVLKQLADIPDLTGGDRIKAMNIFLQRHLDPEDFRLVVRRLLNPDDAFSAEMYTDLYRQAVTVGTARPFRLSSVSPGRRSTAGGLSEPSWPLAAYRHRSRH